MAHKRTQDIPLDITRVDMGDTVSAVLTITTEKGYRGGVESEVTVFWLGGHFRRHAFGIGGGGDYSKKVLLTPGICTQKKIDTQHAEVFTAERIEQVKAEVRAYYAPDPEKERREDAARENQAAMGAAVKELIDSGVNASRALQMLNID